MYLTERAAENRNFPWGVPRFRKQMDTCTLYQRHFINGYSNTYRVPLFSGYHLTDDVSIFLCSSYYSYFSIYL